MESFIYVLVTCLCLVRANVAPLSGNRVKSFLLNDRNANPNWREVLATGDDDDDLFDDEDDYSDEDDGPPNINTILYQFKSLKHENAENEEYKKEMSLNLKQIYSELNQMRIETEEENPSKEYFFKAINSKLPQQGKECAAGEVCLPLLECKKTLGTFCAQDMLDRVCANDGNGDIKICCGADSTCGRPRVVGGSSNETNQLNPTPLGAYPWMVAILWERELDGRKLILPGSLITNRYVLTAQGSVNHRKWNILDGYEIKGVIIGSRNVSSAMECITASEDGHRECFRRHQVGIQDIIEHPDSSRIANDLAIIRLDVQLDFNDPNELLEPVCLPAHDIETSGLEGILLGWRIEYVEDPRYGFNDYFPDSYLSGEVVSFDEDPICREKFIHVSPHWEKTVCITSETRGETEERSHFFVSGQLVLEHNPGQFTLAGIASTTVYQGGPNYFQRITVVSKYMDWILNVVMK